MIQKFMNKTFGIVSGIILAAFIGATAATLSTVYYFKTVQKQSLQAPAGQSIKTSPEQQLAVPPQAPPTTAGSQQAPSTLSQDPAQDPGVIWLPQPQKISQDLKLFRVPNSSDVAEGVEYYKAGTDNGNDIIIAVIPPEGPGDDYLAYLRKTSDGVYEYIAQNSDNYDAEEKQFYSAQPVSTVRINGQTLYVSIQTQSTLTYRGVALEHTNTSLPQEVKQTIHRERVTQTPYGVLYSQTQPGPVKELLAQSFLLVKQNGLEGGYQYTPRDLLFDNAVADVMWTNGKQNSDAFMIINTSGCGGGPYITILNESAVSDIAQAGKTSKGEPIYSFSNPNHPVIQLLYKATGGTYYGADGESHALSLKEFQNNHPTLIKKDELGRYVVYNNSTWGPAVECGKPVIYLYPEKPTAVSVNVDADITKSDPPYGNGWNVNARPNGALLYGDTPYDSLFWEGTGHGAYPTIDRGFIIAKKDGEKTLRSHLTRLGLNQKESRDFLTFWLPKMPATPYIRLSWLTTHDMNELAPLAITPAPDTLIRVFLDFEGLEKQSDIKPQTLPSSLPRNGFTVVEWGGLLRR